MGDAGLGLITAFHYDYNHQSAKNKAFVAAYNAEFKRNPDMFSVGGYDGMHVIYEALKKTGGKTDGDALIAAAKGMAWESPRGPMSIDPETRDVVQTVYIRRVEKVGGELVNVEFDKIENVKDPWKARHAEVSRRSRCGRAAEGDDRNDHVAVRRAVRRLRLRHAAVPAVGRAVGDARDDEFRQSRALHLRDDRRLRHRDADEQLRVAVPGHPARRVHRGGGDQRRVRAHHVPPALPGERPRPVPAHHRAGVRLDRVVGLHLRHHPAAGEPADLPARLDRGRRASRSASIASS